MDGFYMLVAERGGAPTHKHWSLEEARREAERLATTIGGKVFVLEAVAVCEKNDLRWERIGDPCDHDSVPF